VSIKLDDKELSRQTVIGTVASHEMPFPGYQIRLFVRDPNASRNLLIDSRGGEAIRPCSRHVTLQLHFTMKRQASQ